MSLRCFTRPSTVLAVSLLVTCSVIALNLYHFQFSTRASSQEAHQCSSNRLLHRERFNITQPRVDRVVVHYHFAKCAGRLLFSVAQQNGLHGQWGHSETGWDTAMLQLDLLGLLTQQSCLLQEQHLRNMRVPSWLTLEFRFNWLQNCQFSRDRILTFTVIRHPVSRLASQFSYAVRHQLWHANAKTAKQLVESASDNVFMNDYTVRRILGMIDRKELRERKIADSEVQFALQLLDHIDLVVPLERMCEVKPILKRVFGWTNMKLIDMSFPSNKNAFKEFNVQGEKLITAFNREDQDEVIGNNQADLLLWEKANSIFDELLSQLPREELLECEPLNYKFVPYNEILKDETWGPSVTIEFDQTALCGDHQGRYEGEHGSENVVLVNPCVSTEKQIFHLTNSGHLTNHLRDVCVEPCNRELCLKICEDNTAKWHYESTTRRLIHDATGHCATIDRQLVMDMKRLQDEDRDSESDGSTDEPPDNEQSEATEKIHNQIYLSACGDSETEIQIVDLRRSETV